MRERSDRLLTRAARLGYGKATRAKAKVVVLLKTRPDAGVRRDAAWLLSRTPSPEGRKAIEEVIQANRYPPQQPYFKNRLKELTERKPGL